MIIDWKTVRIFVKPGATDMRKQINGLSVIVSEELKMNVFGVCQRSCRFNLSPGHGASGGFRGGVWIPPCLGKSILDPSTTKVFASSLMPKPSARRFLGV